MRGIFGNDPPRSSVAIEKDNAQADNDFERGLRDNIAKLRYSPVAGITVENGVVIASLRQEIDFASSDLFGKMLFEIVDHPNTRGVVLGFKAVTAISSAALGKCVTANKKLKERGLPGLAMVEMHSAIQATIREFKLDNLFIICGDLPTITAAIEEARSKLAAAAGAQAGTEH